MSQNRNDDYRPPGDGIGILLLAGAAMAMCFTVVLLAAFAWSLGLLIGILVALLAAVLMVAAHRKFMKHG